MKTWAGVIVPGDIKPTYSHSIRLNGISCPWSAYLSAWLPLTDSCELDIGDFYEIFEKFQISLKSDTLHEHVNTFYGIKSP
jgi:hypothetical protein